MDSFNLDDSFDIDDNEGFLSAVFEAESKKIDNEIHAKTPCEEVCRKESSTNIRKSYEKLNGEIENYSLVQPGENQEHNKPSVHPNQISKNILSTPKNTEMTVTRNTINGSQHQNTNQNSHMNPEVSRFIPRDLSPPVPKSHLVKNVAQGTPQSGKSSVPVKRQISPQQSNVDILENMGSSAKRKRKFPGPAGLLPSLKFNKSDLTPIQNASHSTKAQETESEPILLSSQVSEDHFSDILWKSMERDMEPQASNILSKFSLANAIRMTMRKQLPNGKIPIVCAVIVSLNLSNEEALVELKDKSGTIKGTLNKQLMKEHGHLISCGTVLVLRQVGVFCASLHRNFHLNITPTNLVRIYSNENSNQSVMNTCAGRFEDADYIVPAPQQINQTICSPGVNATTRPSLYQEPGQAISRPWSTTQRPQFRPRGPNVSMSSPALQHRMPRNPRGGYGTPRNQQASSSRIRPSGQSVITPSPHGNVGKRATVQSSSMPFNEIGNVTLTRSSAPAPSSSMKPALNSPCEPSTTTSTQQTSSSRTFNFKRSCNSSNNLPPSAPGRNTNIVSKGDGTPANHSVNLESDNLWDEDPIDDLLTQIGDEMFSDF